MIYLATDHRGFELKKKIRTWLKEWGEEYEDMGNVSYDKDDDYPDYASKVAEAVSQGKGRGVVICGSGVGVSFVANKYKGVRSMVGINQEQVEHGVKHDQANVLSLAANHFTDEQMKEMLEMFLKTEFGEEERFLRRSDKIKKIENINFK